MHNLIDIDDLRKQFVDKIDSKELKEFATNQHKLVEDLILRNRALEQQITALRARLDSPVLSGVTRMTPEELICIKQLEILHGKSEERELTSDEVKKLDILIKNLRLIQGESTTVTSTVDYTKEKEEDLVAIAASGTRA